MSKLVVSTIEAQTYKYDSDTTGMTINNSGQILMPARPAFRVRHVSGSTTAVGGVLPFNTVDYNVGTHYDTGNYYFVVPVTGFYCFQFNGLASNSSGQKVDANIATVVEMQKSTSSSFSSYTIFGTCYDATTSSTTYPDMSFSISELLNANEYVRLNVIGGNIYTDASANQKYDPVFTGFLVG